MRELAEHDGETEYARLWTLDDHERVLFITHLTPESATRYQFNLHDPAERRCELTKGDGTTPPRVVVGLLNAEGFTVTNLPNISEEAPDVRAKQIGRAIGWLTKHGGLDPDYLRNFAYTRAQNVMVTIYLSHFMMELFGPAHFTDTLQRMFDDADLSSQSPTPEELVTQMNDPIEFLQKAIVEMRRSLSREDQERLIELAEERYGVTFSSLDEYPNEDPWEAAGPSEETFKVPKDAISTLIEQGWLHEEGLSASFR